MSLYDAADVFWKTVKIECVQRNLEKLNEYTQSLGKSYSNGSVVAKVFSLKNDNIDKEYTVEIILRSLLASRLLAHKVVVQAFNGYRTIDGFGEKQDFCEMIPYELPGYLGSVIQNGGAYSSCKPDMKNFYLGLSVALEISDNDLNNLYVVSSHSAWSSFFKDVAWDYTLIAYNKLRNEIVVLMATDED